MIQIMGELRAQVGYLGIMLPLSLKWYMEFMNPRRPRTARQSLLEVVRGCSSRLCEFCAQKAEEGHGWEDARSAPGHHSFRERLPVGGTITIASRLRVGC